MYGYQVSKTAKIFVGTIVFLMFLTFVAGFVFGNEKSNRGPSLSQQEIEFIVQKTKHCKMLALIAQRTAEMRDKKVDPATAVEKILEEFVDLSKTPKSVLEQIIQLIIDVYNSKLTPKEVNIVTFAHCSGVVTGIVLGARQCSPGYWM